MNTKILVESNHLSKADLKILLQVIRTTEQQVFPEKEISIFVMAPELKTQEMIEILGSINPPLHYGPVVFSTT